MAATELATPLTMPVETEFSSPKGLPIATTFSPMVILSESASFSVGSPRPDTFTIATSASESTAEIPSTGNTAPFDILTKISRAP